MTSRRSFLSLAAAAAAWSAIPARAQERFSPFVGSNPDNVRRMVALADLRAGDTVIDLGSGDGRIVFAALAAHPQIRGIGVDINAELVQKANAAAREQGVAERVRFLHQNVFDADLAGVDVVFMWLFPELMRLLRPKILAQAKPGARIIVATWDLGSWPADAVDDQGGALPTIRKWIVPARIDGGWQWDVALRERSYRFNGLFEQRMQQAEGVVRMERRREICQHVILRGETLQFTVRMTLPGLGYVSLAHSGQIRGERIEGTVTAQLPVPGDDETMEEVRVPWQAQRGSDDGYFAPTGTSLT